ncbi:NAD(P)-binding protein [Atractiella rhizophila]|nr:NAD(P)-binding protein [Atractiella rhizophila]
MPSAAVFLSVLGFPIYLYLVRQRLLRPLLQPSTPRPSVLPPPTELEKLSVYTHTISSILSSFPAASSPTGKNYVVLGGAGYVGGWIVRFLIGRGEKNVRVLDWELPKGLDEKGMLDGVEYVKVDLRDRNGVKEKMGMAWRNGRGTERIFHTIALMRFWERGDLTLPYSYRTTVDGTQNVMDAIDALPIPPEALVYTSSAGCRLKPVEILRLRKQNPVIKDEDEEFECHSSHWNYSYTKQTAERLVLRSDGTRGMRTGSLRPGMAIVGTGPQEQFMCQAYRDKRLYAYSDTFTHTNINVMDLTMGHLLLEAALTSADEEKRNQVGGQAYLITGSRDMIFTDGDINKITKFNCPELEIVQLPVTMLYVFSHIIELFLNARLRFLKLFTSAFENGKLPAAAPKWLGQGRLFQPAFFEPSLMDVIIDDSRARKHLGYEPKWTTFQSWKWMADYVKGGEEKWQREIGGGDGTWKEKMD